MSTLATLTMLPQLPPEDYKVQKVQRQAQLDPQVNLLMIEAVLQTQKRIPAQKPVLVPMRIMNRQRRPSQVRRKKSPLSRRIRVHQVEMLPLSRQVQVRLARPRLVEVLRPARLILKILK